MVHQFIYLVHEHTDEFGWQFRHQWPHSAPGPKDEPWSSKQNSSSRVRRRIWMTTVVPRQDLVRAKRYLAENLRVDNGMIKKQGELFRYEKGTLTHTWNKRRVVLYHNRIEFYSGNNKKGEVLLNDVEVRMLFDTQCQGRRYAFSIRNATGSVGVLLDAEDELVRRSWVMAIQYQLMITSFEMNFPPLEIAPPTSDYPDNRVFVSGDLMLQGSDGTWIPRHFQLLTRELIYFQETNMRGRIFLEQAKIISEERLLTFSITTTSGITINLIAGNAEAKNVWVNGLSRQIQAIENQKLKLRTVPKEEQFDDYSPMDRLAQLREGNWYSPPVDGETSEYVKKTFNFHNCNNFENYEFSEELNIFTDPRPKPHLGSGSSLVAAGFEEVFPSIEVGGGGGSNGVKPMESSGSMESPSIEKNERRESHSSREGRASLGGGESRSSMRFSQLLQTKSFLFAGEAKLLDPKRNLINPRFMLASLKGVTHRFVLVLESEMRETAKREIKVLAPPRFTVGGPRASKDPRTVYLNQLIGVSNTLPEIQLPAGWFMLHQYIYIVQQNTDDFGWQYRTAWSDGPLKSSDEQWIDTHDDAKYVRRRLWMTTVVKRDDMIQGKKMVYEELNKSKGEAIYQEFLFFYHPGQTESDPDWHRRKVILYHDKMEFFAENNKIGEASLLDCEVCLLVGEDNMGKENAFRIRHPNGSVDVILAADSRAVMLRWVKALKYQFAIITPDVNFEPFFYGPPTGELPESRVILCGEVEVSDHNQTTGAQKWEPYQLVLQERILLCYSRDNLTGRLMLEGATVKSEEENEFILKLATNLQVRFRAESSDLKVSWVRTLKRQIQYIEYRKSGLTPVSDEHLTHREVFTLYKDPDWVAQEINFQEDELHMEAVRHSYNEKLHQIWSGFTTTQQSAVTSPSNHALPLRGMPAPYTAPESKHTSSSSTHFGQGMAAGAAGVGHHVAGAAGMITSANLADYKDDNDDWADYSVYSKPRGEISVGEIAEPQAGYGGVPTPNLSEHSGYSRRSEALYGKTIKENNNLQQPVPKKVSPPPRNEIDFDSFPEEEKEDRVPQVKILSVSRAVMELDLEDSYDEDQLRHPSSMLVPEIDDEYVDDDDDDTPFKQKIEGAESFIPPESPLTEPDIDTMDGNNIEVIEEVTTTEQDGEFITTTTTTTVEKTVFVKQTTAGGEVKLVQLAEAYPELKPVPEIAGQSVEPAKPVIPVVALKPTPEVPSTPKGHRRMHSGNSELYQNQLFQKQAEVHEGEEDGEVPLRPTSNTSYGTAAHSLRDGDFIKMEDEHNNHNRGSKGSHHIVTIRDDNNQTYGASNDFNDQMMMNQALDHDEFYHKYQKTMELDTQKEYTVDPDALHAANLLERLHTNKANMQNSNNNLLDDGQRDSDKFKRNSLEEYMQKHDEPESFMITAKNLRHVDDAMHRDRTKDSEDEVMNIDPKQKFVQLRSVNDQESFYSNEGNVNTTTVTTSETIYTTVKLRNVPLTEKEKERQKEEENNILKQVKLRNVQSKVKSELGEGDGSLPNSAHVSASSAMTPINPDVELDIPEAPATVTFGSVKSRIQLFEKTKSPDSSSSTTPVTPTSSRKNSLIKTIQNTIQEQKNNSSPSYIGASPSLVNKNISTINSNNKNWNK
jgi:hypothetical protein